MEIASDAIADYEIGGAYDTTSQFLFTEEISVNESISFYSGFFFDEQISVVEKIQFGSSFLFIETISIISTFLFRMLSTGPIKKMSNLWNRTKETMNKLLP